MTQHWTLYQYNIKSAFLLLKNRFFFLRCCHDCIRCNYAHDSAYKFEASITAWFIGICCSYVFVAWYVLNYAASVKSRSANHAPTLRQIRIILRVSLNLLLVWSNHSGDEYIYLFYIYLNREIFSAFRKNPYALID